MKKFIFFLDFHRQNVIILSMKTKENCSYDELKNLHVLALNKVGVLENEINLFKNENTYLKEQLAWFQKQIFGKKSEKIVADLDKKQLFFEGFEPIKIGEEKLKNIKAHTRKTSSKEKTKIVIPPDIETKEIIIDIPESEKICPITQKPLIKIGEEISYKLACLPGTYYLKKIIRPKYAMPNQEGIKTALMPDSIIPKCRADESLLADILTKKYADHLPLYRTQEELLRNGIGIPRKLMSKWIIKIGLALEPLVDEMKKRIMNSGNIFIDETPINIQDSPKVKQGYLWMVTGGQLKDPFYRVYNFELNRKHENAIKILQDYGGILHSDKYGAYETLAKDKQFIWCPCYVHIRRKFFESQTDPQFTNLILRKIKYIFMFERIALEKTEEERLKIRKEKEEPIIDDLIELVKNKMQDKRLLPKSKLKEALGYFHGLIPYLKNYIKYPWARLDNNVAERAIRPIAIGRKNWLFVGSKDAGRAAAIIMSLVQTCRALNINPRAYLEDVLKRFMSHSFNKIYELLPDEWALSLNG
jgi:transposase